MTETLQRESLLLVSHCWERKQTCTSTIHKSGSIIVVKSFLGHRSRQCFWPTSQNGFDFQRQKKSRKQIILPFTVLIFRGYFSLQHESFLRKEMLQPPSILTALSHLLRNPFWNPPAKSQTIIKVRRLTQHIYRTPTPNSQVIISMQTAGLWLKQMGSSFCPLPLQCIPKDID